MDSSLVQNALKNNLFTLYYQPKINLHTKKVESAEALIRIENDEELILPFSFIPLAEKSGEIFEIDRWVFERLMDDSRYISMMSHEDITISFNVSSQHFNKKSFIENIENIFNYTTDFLSQFEIELTEYALIENIEKSKQKMDRLKEKGFRIAIDDFGTGYSSFLYLKDFPIDTIKIDKAFIDHLEDDEKTRRITASIIYLAKQLELKTVAEGVESVEQVEWLYKNGCDEIQGFYYSKPLSLEEFVRFVKAVNQATTKNSFIVWGSKYSIGNQAFDTQHMIIAGILNKLYDELKNKEMKEKSDINIYFSLLKRYIDLHFKAEETYMREHQFDGYLEHLKEHRSFKKVIEDFEKNLSGSNKKDALELFSILRSWFLDHELKKDKLFIQK